MGQSPVLILHGLTHIASDYLTECKKDARANGGYHRWLQVQKAQRELDERARFARATFLVIDGDKK